MAISARYMRKKGKLPRFKSDKEAEQFVEKADLTGYALFGMRPVRFEFQPTSDAKGGNLQCHWNTFTAFALSCSTSSSGATPDTVVFTASGGGTCGSETVKIVDGGKKPDTIQVVATNQALNVPASSLVSGNFTIHK